MVTPFVQKFSHGVPIAQARMQQAQAARGRTQARPGSRNAMMGGGPLVNNNQLTNPAGVINAQNAANTQNANLQGTLNRPNETNPLGSSEWSVGPDGRPVRTSSLSPQEQQLFNQTYGVNSGALGTAQNLLNNQAGNISQGLNYNNAPQIPGQGDLMGQENRVENQQYQNYLAQTQPQQQQATKDFQAQMASQGIPENSDNYQYQADRLRQSQGLQNQNALTEAQKQGQSLAGQQFGQGLQARQQGVGEANTLYNAPLQGLNALMGIGPGVQLPNFSAIQNVNTQPTDVYGPTNAFMTNDTNRFGIGTNALTARAVAGIQAGGAANVANINAASNMAQIMAQINARKPTLGSQIGGILGPGLGSIGGSLVNGWMGNGQTGGTGGSLDPNTIDPGNMVSSGVPDFSFQNA